MSNIYDAKKISVTSTESEYIFPFLTTSLLLYNEGPDTAYFQTDNRTLEPDIGVPIPVDKSWSDDDISIRKVKFICESGKTATIRIIGKL